MKQYYVTVTEDHQVYGGCDYNGRSVAWTFDNKSIAREFLKDFRSY